ncbi:MAG: tRNA (adenosine(37)-N6)-threonylcarbamoyltransferase complex ATPase subunit type 1 TsaE [Pseudomonadota bacterium]|nr:tRNA (adenosine(37)-N6)-threonylcarbamoyltransferase complex ATPase subunit type 1 TsaE [Pseudomonadota bacterium]
MYIGKLNINSEKQTKSIANNLYQLSKIGDIFALYGNIGVGKTTFARHFINGAVDKQNISSPSYNIYFIYESIKAPIFHMDAWRLKSGFDILNLGISDYFNEAIFLIEWANKIESHLPSNKLKVKLEYNENIRTLTFDGDETWKKRLENKFSRDLIDKNY